VAVYSFTDAIIHSRITNDEKVLKKVVKRFHTYASVAYPLHPPETPPEPAAIEEAKELFRVELESFHLTLKKAVLVCEAERRQVEQYEREKQRIGVWRRHTRPSRTDATLSEDEREALKGHIEQLKTSLEDAQLSRRQMIEYDLIAEKINQLPSRDELQQ
jgi:THO complex subunit 7